jgi:hypothetical protein
MSNDSPTHPVLSFYKPTHRGTIEHVNTVHSEDDDVNIAGWHPHSFGVVYGTKEGRVRVIDAVADRVAAGGETHSLTDSRGGSGGGRKAGRKAAGGGDATTAMDATAMDAMAMPEGPWHPWKASPLALLWPKRLPNNR